jgi:hypothetical protein
VTVTDLGVIGVDSAATVINTSITGVDSAATVNEQCYGCTDDAYEPDDDCIASEAVIHDGETFSLNFCNDAEDWISFNACAGRSYTIDTSNLGPLADTVLELYGTDCTTLLDSDDNGGSGNASLINWTAPAPGTYHVKVIQFDATTGKDRGYDVTLTGDTSPCATWARTYGGTSDDRAFSIEQTTDGSFVVARRTYSFGAGDFDFWVLKLDTLGNVQWEKTYGGAGGEDTRFIQPTTDGGYVVAGLTDSFGAGNWDYWALKLDASGNVQWQKTYGGASNDRGLSIQQTTDGGFVIAGGTYSFGAGDWDFWVLKLDTSGNVAWQKTYGGTNEDIAFFLKQTSDGGYVVAGHTYSFGAGNYDFWVLKLDASGNVTWQKTYGGASADAALSIQQTTDGGFVVTGWTESFGAGSYDLWVLKLDASGNVQWQKTYGGTDSERAYSIRQTTDGGFIVAGWTGSFGAGGWDSWVLKLDASGTVQWQKTFGGALDEQAFSIEQTTDGGFVAAGYTNSFGAGSYDFWVLKMDANGNIDPSCTFIADTAATITDTSATVTFTGASGIVSSATVTDTAVSGVVSSATVMEQCNDCPTLSVSAGVDSATVCLGVMQTYTATPTGGKAPLTFEWDFSYDGVTFNVEGTGNPVSYAQLSAGSYTVRVRVTDSCAAGAQVAEADVPITVNALPAPTITPDGPTTFCDGSSVTLDAGVWTSYSWSTGATTQTINVTASGSYTATVTDGNGCSGTSAPETVTVNALPTPTITPDGPTTFCEGGSVTLDAGAWPGYSWSTGETTQTINVTASGSYTVTVTDGNGCSGTSAPEVVTVNANPTPVITVADLYTQLTNNTEDDYYPQIHKGQVAWQGWDGSDWEIYFWDGVSTIQITNNSLYDRPPQMHNGQIVWSAYDGNDDEIFFWDGVTTTQLTNNTYNDWRPQIHNGQLVWDGSDGTDYEIFFWDGVTTTQLTNNTTTDMLPQIHNGQVVWMGDEIFFWDGVSTTQLTNNGTGGYPQIHNGQVVWHSADDIFFWDGVSTTQITNNALNNSFPEIDNGQIVWAGGPGGGTLEVFFWDGVSTTQLTNNNYNDHDPQIQNGQVVWMGHNGDDREVFFWDGVSTRQLTSNTYADAFPQMDNGQIVWHGDDGADYEIILWTDLEFCEGDSVGLIANTATGAPPFSYLWSPGGETTQSITAIANGSYTVTITDANSCADVSGPAMMTVNPTPTPTITPDGPTTFCDGGSVTLDAGAWSSYSWSTGATTQTINVTVSGSYTVTVTDGNGCSGTSAVEEVTVNPLPSANPSAAAPNPACVGAGVQFDANPAGGTPPYSYEWDFDNDSIVDNTVKNPLYAYPAAGSYTALVNVTDAKGCMSGWTAVPNNQIVVNPPAVAYDTSFDPVATLAEDCGDGDTVVEPGERWSATVQLENTSATCNATNVLADLTVNAGSVVAATVCNNPGSYGDILALGTATFTYSFLVDSGAVCINDITFDVTGIVSDELAYPSEIPAFAVQVGVMNVGATETGNQVTDPLNATSATAASDFAPAFTLASAQTATLSYTLSYVPPSVLETSTQSVDPITANNNTAQSILGPAFSLSAPAISASLSYTLTGTSDLANCVRVELIDPFSTATILKDYGVADANPYDVTALYTGPGTYILSLTELTGCSPNPKDAVISSAQMDVTAFGSEDATTSVLIELVDPSLTVTPLKDYGVADASPYDVTALYTGAGTYRIQVSENAGGIATVTAGTLSVTEPDWIECDAGACACPVAPPTEPSAVGSPDPLLIPTTAADQIIVEDVENETGYVVYESAIGTWYGTPSQGCLWGADVVDLGATVQLNYPLGAGDRWVVVSAANASGESSCGMDSAGAERNAQPGWPAPGPCP